MFATVGALETSEVELLVDFKAEQMKLGVE